MVSDLKIVALDIETMPALVYTYNLFKPMISHKQIVEPSRITCFSYQVLGSKSVKFVSEYHDGPKELMDELWRVLDEADVILGYNSKGFDVPWITGELMAEGYKQPSPVKHIDLYQVMRKHTRFLSRKLDYVSERLLDDKKVDVNTMELAIRCASSDPEVARKAWNEMRKYSKKDVALLFPLYERVKSYIKMPHPVSSDPSSCHNCGSTDIRPRGFTYTALSKYRRYRCEDCGKWFRGTTRIEVTELRSVE